MTETSAQVRLARKIARQYRALDERKGARAGDVLVLVRQRGALFEAIIRALKDAEIPVAGADRLVLTEHIAVMDLMVLADALLLPDDDLALATVLKSPLFGLDDDDLFEIAWQRRGSLRAALRAKARAQPRFADAVDKLDRYAHGRGARRRSDSTAGCSDRRAAASASWRGSATRPTTRSTNSSISRSTTSAARRPRCKASSPGCARPRPT